MEALIALVPLGYGIYYLTRPSKSDVAVERDAGEYDQERAWTPTNRLHYTDIPFNSAKVLPGDHFQYSLHDPHGPIQKAMEGASSPEQALAILTDHEMDRDIQVQNKWKDFAKPNAEISTRTLDTPITQVTFLGHGTEAERLITTGARFWDRPVPRSTGIDRYYPRDVQRPYYETPNPQYGRI